MRAPILPSFWTRADPFRLVVRTGKDRARSKLIVWSNKR